MINMTAKFFYNLTFILSFAFIISACSPGIVYEEYADISDAKWEYEKPVTFEVDIPKAGSYKIFCNIRHNNDYHYANLWVQLFSYPPKGKPKKQRFEIRLARKDGKWLGNGIGGTLTREALLLNDFQAEKAGKYTFTIQHDMRLNVVPAISHVGIRVEEKGKK